MILPDHWILARCREGMITPYAVGEKRPGVVSYGISSYGYDVRAADEWSYIPHYPSGAVRPLIDIKRAGMAPHMITRTAPYFDIPPHGFVLCRSLEYFRIPRNVLVTVLGKSTYARCGLIVNVTPLEPEWEGHITIELSNTTALPLRVYANEGIAQCLFYQGSAPPDVSYADKQGKYQGQTGITMPRIE